MRTRCELSHQPGPRILIVDDEVRIRRFVCLALEQNEWEVIDGLEATDQVREADPDLIINLPDVDEFEVFRRIREISAAP